MPAMSARTATTMRKRATSERQWLMRHRALFGRSSNSWRVLEGRVVVASVSWSESSLNASSSRKFGESMSAYVGDDGHFLERLRGASLVNRSQIAMAEGLQRWDAMVPRSWNQSVRQVKVGG